MARSYSLLPMHGEQNYDGAVLNFLVYKNNVLFYSQSMPFLYWGEGVLEV